MAGKLFRDKALFAAICALALPTVIEQALQTVVQYVDTAMVGRLGAQASAAVGLTTTMTWLVNGPCFAMGIGVLSCISKAAGARDAAKIRSAAVQSIYIALATGLLTGAVSLAVSPFLPGWLGAGEAIRRDAFLYFFIISLPMLFRVSGIVFGFVLRAVGDTKTPMLINTLMNVCNIVLNYFLIGSPRAVTLGPWRFSVWGAGLGVAGAAAATAVSHVLGGTLMFAALLRNPQLSPWGGPLRIDGPVMRECVFVGLPIAAERAAACLGQVVFTGMVTRLGTLSIAAHSIALTAEQAFYVPGYGMQAAAATLSGNAVGGRDGHKLTRVAAAITAIAVAVMGLLALLLFFFPAFMMSIFTSDQTSY